MNHLDESYDGEIPDALDNAFVVVDYDGGVRAMLDLCMFAEASRNQHEVCATGDRGKVECFMPENLVVIGERTERRIETIRVPDDPDVVESDSRRGATYYQQRAILDAIRDPSAARIGAHTGRDAVALGVAAQRSIDEGAPIEVDSLVV